MKVELMAAAGSERSSRWYARAAWADDDGPAAAESQHKVLLIDDSLTVRVATERALSERGFRVVTSDNPILLPFLIRSEAPDVVLLDVEMPAVEGDKAAQVMNVGGADGSGGPLIFLYSNKPEEELRERAKGCEAHGFIRKGKDFDALAARLRRAIREDGG